MKKSDFYACIAYIVLYLVGFIAYYLYYKHISANWVETIGVVENISGSYMRSSASQEFMLNYEVDGEQYHTEIRKYQNNGNKSSQKPAYHIGEELEIYYNPVNPNRVIVKREIKLTIGLLLLGAFISTAGFISVIVITSS